MSRAVKLGGLDLWIEGLILGPSQAARRFSPKSKCHMANEPDETWGLVGSFSLRMVFGGRFWVTRRLRRESRGWRIWLIRGVTTGLKCGMRCFPRGAQSSPCQRSGQPFISFSRSSCPHFRSVLHPAFQPRPSSHEVEMSPSSLSSSSSTSSLSSSSSTSSPSGLRAKVVSVSSGGTRSEAAGSSSALKTLKLWHDVDLVVIEDLLGYFGIVIVS